MQSVHRPLHPLNVNQSSYSSLAGAVHGIVLPPRSGPSQAKPSTGRRVIETEVRSSRPKGSPCPFTPKATISFRRSQPSSLFREGLTFREILDGRRDLLVGAQDIVFSGWTQQTVTLEFDWPGYSHTEQKRTIKLLQHGRPIDRFELARQVCTVYDNHFFRTAKCDRCRLHADENHSVAWDLGQGHPDFNFLVLTGITNEDDKSRTFRATIKLLTFV
ncbi:hypothetical protein C8Q73DRAFT_321311 [Cubamyces lactineus]|nr:hypothetical protein C8Q73DRAFT_321311 [Cubamyces lactineus]